MELLLKFIKEEYIEDYLKGELYFSRISNFLDSNEQNTINDMLEGKYTLETILTPKNSKQSMVAPNIPGKATIDIEVIKNMPITCFTLISGDDLEKTEMGLKIRKDIVEELRELSYVDEGSPRLCVITPFCKLMCAVHESQRENMVGRKVIYYEDRVSDLLSYEAFNANPWLVTFYKRKKYSFQREYRLLINEQHDEDIKVKIGSISKMSGVCTYDELHNFCML